MCAFFAGGCFVLILTLLGATRIITVRGINIIEQCIDGTVARKPFL